MVTFCLHSFNSTDWWSWYCHLKASCSLDLYGKSEISCVISWTLCSLQLSWHFQKWVYQSWYCSIYCSAGERKRSQVDHQHRPINAAVDYLELQWYWTVYCFTDYVNSWGHCHYYWWFGCCHLRITYTFVIDWIVLGCSPHLSDSSKEN